MTPDQLLTSTMSIQHVISSVTSWVNSGGLCGIYYFKGVGYLDMGTKDVSRRRAYPGVSCRMLGVEISVR